MPTIAWLSAETPDRHGSGGERRQFHQIRVLLERGIGVHAATLEGPGDDTSLRELVPVTRVPWRRGLRLRAHRDVAGFLAAPEFDAAVVAHVESLHFSGNALRRARLPVLVDFHNVYSRWHHARGESKEAERWRRREHAALHLSVRATACSEEERGALLALETGADVDVAPHGVDPDEWPDSALSGEREPSLALFGAWGHRPNREGAEWLLRDVWPAVAQAIPRARLYLAGPGASPASSDPRVEALGRVASLAQLLGRVRIAVVPIVQGVGARVKFAEALASGAAVVSTSVGAEGYEADGAFVRADGAAAFTEACIALLRDPGRAEALGRAGRALAFERLTWELTSEPLIRFAEKAAA